MISACAWVPRGAAKSAPVRSTLDEEDEAMLREAAEEMRREEGGSAPTPKEDGGKGKAKKGSVREVIEEYNLDDYDDESDGGIPMFTAGLKGALYHGGDDPYVTLKGENEDDEEDREDETIRATDSLLLACKTEDDFSILEVHVYEESKSNLFVHHDVILPAFPLCVEWVDYNSANPEEAGNFAAVGTFRPEIEIWDIDVLDAVDPVVVLGGEGAESLKKKKGKKSKPQFVEGSHSDAVMGLSWNRKHRNFLASGSADKTIKLWDIAAQKAVHTLTHHTDKVQSVQWNPHEPSVLMSGSYDRTLCVLDVRQPLATNKYKLTADVESCHWNPHEPTYTLVATEDGNVTCFDARSNGGNAVFTLSAHSKPVSAFAVNPVIPGLIATGSTDKTVKVWDIAGNKPSLVQSRELGVGAIFALSFMPDSPLTLGLGGGKGDMAVWDCGESKAVRKAFGKRLRESRLGASEVVKEVLERQDDVGDHDKDMQREDVESDGPSDLEDEGMNMGHGDEDGEFDGSDEGGDNMEEDDEEEEDAGDATKPAPRKTKASKSKPKRGKK